MANRHLESHKPAWIEAPNQLLDHQGLETVYESRACTREVANAEICAECDADRGQYLQARCGLSGFDSSEVGSMDADDRTELGKSESRVESEPAYLLPELKV
jgi:hypothetical protein